MDSGMIVSVWWDRSDEGKNPTKIKLDALTNADWTVMGRELRLGKITHLTVSPVIKQKMSDWESTFCLQYWNGEEWRTLIDSKNGEKFTVVREGAYRWDAKEWLNTYGDDDMKMFAQFPLKWEEVK